MNKTYTIYLVETPFNYGEWFELDGRNYDEVLFMLNIVSGQNGEVELVIHADADDGEDGETNVG